MAGSVPLPPGYEWAKIVTAQLMVKVRRDDQVEVFEHTIVV